jgi:glycosyltransferase involved in cell wall biosynthesis
MKKKTNVQLLCQHFYPEMISTGMHMTELALGLTGLDCDIVVCCAQPSLSLEDANTKVPSAMNYHGIRIKRVASWGSHAGSLISRGLFATSYFVMSAWEMLLKHKEFIGTLVTTNPPFLGLLGLLLKKAYGKPYVLIIYDVYPDIALKLGVLRSGSLVARLWEKLSSTVMNAADANVVIGRDMLEIVKSKINPERHSRIHLIPNWSDETGVHPVAKEKNPFRTEHGLEGKFVVQYSGRMARTHNLEPLMDAAASLNNGKVIFQFIGDGAKKKILIDIVRQKNLKNVQFLPYQPLDRLAEVLSAADVSVVCLEKEYMGLSVPSKAYGVMAGGVPILGLVQPESEIGRMIVENDCGFVLANPEGREIARLIEKLVADRVYLEKIGRNGRKAFLENYTLTLAAKRYKELIDKTFC